MCIFTHLFNIKNGWNLKVCTCWSRFWWVKCLHYVDVFLFWFISKLMRANFSIKIYISTFFLTDFSPLLSNSWPWQNRHSDWLLPYETLPLHSRWGHRLDPDLQTGLCNRPAAELPGWVSLGVLFPCSQFPAANFLFTVPLVFFPAFFVSFFCEIFLCTNFSRWHYFEVKSWHISLK